jgi:hypothetical protein
VNRKGGRSRPEWGLSTRIGEPCPHEERGQSSCVSLCSATPADTPHDCGCRIVLAARARLRRALSVFRLPDHGWAAWATTLNGTGTSRGARNPFLHDRPHQDGRHARTARNKAARLRNLRRGGGWVDRARVSDVRGGSGRVRRTRVPHIRSRCARVYRERLRSRVVTCGNDQNSREGQRP